MPFPIQHSLVLTPLDTTVFQKELYNGIPYVTVWRVLRKRLHLEAYKLSISGKTWCVLLHYDSSKHCTCPLNKFIQAFKIVKLLLKHLVHREDVDEIANRCKLHITLGRYIRECGYRKSNTSRPAKEPPALSGSQSRSRRRARPRRESSPDLPIDHPAV
jgi:hypothetical protein